MSRTNQTNPKFERNMESITEENGVKNCMKPLNDSKVYEQRILTGK